MIDIKGKSFLLKLYYRRLEILSMLFSALLVFSFYLLAKEGAETRRLEKSYKVLLENQTRYNRFLIDSNGQTIGELHKELIDLAARDRGELRRLEDALRAVGVHLPPQSVLEGPAPVLGASPPSSQGGQSGTVVTGSQGQPTPLPSPRAHSFPNVCLIGICLLGEI